MDPKAITSMPSLNSPPMRFASLRHMTQLIIAPQFCPRSLREKYRWPETWGLKLVTSPRIQMSWIRVSSRMEDMTDEISEIEKTAIPCSSGAPGSPFWAYTINKYYGNGGI